MIEIKEDAFTQPDVSRVTPVFVPHNATRSGNYDLVYVNDYGRYERAVAYWCDIDKTWKRTSGEAIKNEIVRHDGKL